MNLLYYEAVRIYDSLYFKINSGKLALDYDLPNDFSVTFHAGAMHTKPNTIRSIKAAIDANAQIIEIDVSFRPDGTPVIIHNAQPNGGQGVLLEKALEAVAETKSCKLNLDIKSTNNLGAIDKLAESFGLRERVFYTGVFKDWVETVKSSSGIPYFLNHDITERESVDSSAAQAVADYAKQLGAIGINSNYRYAEKLFADVMHQNNLLLSLWTVNEPSDMPKALKISPDNITTKRPVLLRKIAGI